MELNWIAPVLVAIGGIITTIVALRKASEEHSAGAFSRYQKFVDDLRKEMNRQSERIHELEGLRKEDYKRIQNLEEQEYLSAKKVEEMAKEQRNLTAKVNKLGAKVEYYRRGVGLLIKQILDLGVEPAWRPNDEDENSH